MCKGCTEGHWGCHGLCGQLGAGPGLAGLGGAVAECGLCVAQGQGQWSREGREGRVGYRGLQRGPCTSLRWWVRFSGKVR